MLQLWRKTKLPSAADRWQSDRLQVLLVSQLETVSDRLLEIGDSAGVTPRWRVAMDHLLGTDVLNAADSG